MMFFSFVYCISLSELMPAASVCSHTTSPYHTIGGRTDGKRCTESHDNSLVFGHNDLKNQSNLLKKIPQRLQYGRSTCGMDVALASLDKRTGHGESNVSHSNEYGYVQDSWHHVRQTAQLAEHAIVGDWRLGYEVAVVMDMMLAIVTIGRSD